MEIEQNLLPSNPSHSEGIGRTETNLFVPYRALGLICSSVPPVYAPPDVDKQYGLICCALDNQLCLYLINPLRLAFYTERLQSPVTIVAADSMRFFAAFSNFVAIIKNSNIKQTLIIPNGGAKLLLSLGEMLAVVDKRNQINVFDALDGQLLVQLESSESFDITALMHPHTYLNKILVGATDGRMRLWNLRTGRLVHEFQSDPENFNTSIRVLEQSTAIDIVAIGMENGQIHLKNIKYDKLLCTFRQKGQITALAFRTDGVETLASASTDGSIAIWDLNEHILIGQLSNAHNGPINWLHFILGESFLLSAGEDNKIAKWFFRNENSTPELNTTLQGHSAPVTSIKFCSERLILSASAEAHIRRFDTINVNRIKDFGLAREVRRGELSQDRHVDVPLNAIEQIELSHGRESVWDNVLCRHQESPLVSTWSTRRMKRGSHLLYHQRFAKNPELLTAFASSIFLSNCGTYALIGYSSGHVDVFNMQSGKYKFSLQAKKAVNTIKNGTKIRKVRKADLENRAHEALVSGIALDILNRNAVTGSVNGTINFWQFNNAIHSPLLYSRMHVNAGVQLFRLDLHNSLLAVGLENGEVGVVDVLCRRLTRRLLHYSCINWSKDTRLTALEFSNDGKWLLSADNIGFTKIWDLPTGTLIDVMFCSTPCIGMAFSEHGDYLATCHAGHRGVYLWANKLMFMPTASVASKSADELHKNIFTCQLPTLIQSDQQQLEGKEGNDAADQADGCCDSQHTQERVVMIDEEDEEQINVDESEKQENSFQTTTSSIPTQMPSFVEREQLHSSLYTTSGFPASRWAYLPMLDVIRQRNKPIEPPKKAKSAPFFLPTMDTLQGFNFDKEEIKKLVEEETEHEDAAKAQVTRLIAIANRRLNNDNVSLKRHWQRKLLSATTKNEFCDVFAQLKEMSLSAIDFEIRCLDTQMLTQFLSMLIAMLETRRNFDLVQSYLATFLNIHHETIWNIRSEQMDGNNQDESRQMEGTEGNTQESVQKTLLSNLTRLLELQKQAVDELQPLLDRCMSLAEFTRNALL